MNKTKDQASNVTVFGESVRSRESGNIAAGLMFISAGIILLGNNLGIIPWQFWEEIRTLWPIIFVIMGIHVLLGNSIISRLVLFVITVAVLFFIISYGLYAARWIYFPMLPEGILSVLEFIQGSI